jgi:hypothetical protein
MNPKRCENDIFKGKCARNTEHKAHKLYTKNHVVDRFGHLVMYKFEKVYATDARMTLFIRAYVATI